jgi:sporulation protein YlmC with PRC-barrel domain
MSTLPRAGDSESRHQSPKQPARRQVDRATTVKAGTTMQTKIIPAVSAVVLGLSAALMGTTALGQTSPGAAEEPVLQQDQTGVEAAPGHGEAMSPGTGTAPPVPGRAQRDTGTEPGTGMAQTDAVTPGAGTVADEGTPRRSVGMADEPYAGEVLAGVTADELIGMNVVDAEGENVGSIDDLLLGEDGQIDHAIVDVGGFLGFGAKSVAIPLDELQVAPEQDQVLVTITREQLDAMPEWQRGDEGWMAN